jgi:hypothetical protein
MHAARKALILLTGIPSCIAKEIQWFSKVSDKPFYNGISIIELTSPGWVE